MSKAGGKVYYDPAAEVVHFGGGDVGHYDERRLVHFYKGLLLFYRKHYVLTRGVAVRFIIGLRCCIRIVAWVAVSVLKPSLRSKARSSVRGYRRVFEMLFRRA